MFVSHWRNGDLADLDATMISISRGTPRWDPGYRYRRLDQLAPDDATWALEDTAEFERSYARQLEALGADRILFDIERIAGGRAACLLCWERPHETSCHRWTFSRWIREQTGLVVPELQPGDLPLRPDAPQPSLFD